MRSEMDPLGLRELVREVARELCAVTDWPAGRVALDEAEAASVCGVGRHVLRDLRLAGKIKGRRLGKKVVYTRSDLLAALGVIALDSSRDNGADKQGERDNARRRSIR